MRKAALQPPFCDLAVIGFTSADEAEARRAAEGMHEILKKLLLSADPKLPGGAAGGYRRPGFTGLKRPVPAAGYLKVQGTTAACGPLLRQAVAEGEAGRLFQKTSVYIDMNGEL